MNDFQCGIASRLTDYFVDFGVNWVFRDEKNRGASATEGYSEYGGVFVEGEQ